MKFTGNLPQVASLHLHPCTSGAQFIPVTTFEVMEGKGIVGNGRFFERRSRSGGPSRRQVSLIENEQIAEHSAAMGLNNISQGAIRSNIQTNGVDLVALIGKQVQIGDAILFIYEARTGCWKMDLICDGLKKLTEGNRLGVLAQIIQSGRITIGDNIFVVETSDADKNSHQSTG
ncbi:MAG: MOSC domain-containing protein [Verrucomicrobiota bacterium]